MTRELTGKRVLIIALGAFGLILAANMTMLLAATGSFPGLVVKNSYVAGVGWNDRAAAQRELGWETVIALDATGLTVRLHDQAGKVVTGQSLEALIGRPGSDIEDRVLPLHAVSEGYAAPVALGSGAWRVEVKTRSGPAFRVVAEVFVREPS